VWGHGDLLSWESAEDVLRYAFAEADRREIAVCVLAVGPASIEADLVERWAAKYPAVPVTMCARGDVDAAITLTGASRSCALVVVAEPAGHHEAAVVQAVTRRARCAVAVAPSRISSSGEPAGW
jgi:hypothetical protein